MSALTSVYFTEKNSTETFRGNSDQERCADLPVMLTDRFQDSNEISARDNDKR